MLGAVYAGLGAGAGAARLLPPLWSAAALACSILAYWSPAARPSPWLAGAVTALPFAFLGAFVCSLVDASKEPRREYAFHLAGAACGLLAGVLLLGPLGLERCALLAAACVFAGAAAFTELPFIPLACAVVVGVSPALDTTLLFDAERRPDKALFAPEARPIERSRWDAVARIDVARFEGARHLFFNGHPFAPVAGLDRSPGDRMLPLAILRKPKALVIGSGGGLDLAALRRATDDLTAVEISPSVVSLMRGPLLDATNGIYLFAKTHVSDGRAFARRTRETFDLICLPFVDAYAASQPGAAQLEAYLYTAEAFDDYKRLLAPGGLLFLSKHAGETPRILKTWRGRDDQPGRWLAFVGPAARRDRGYLLYKKNGFTAGEERLLSAQAAALGLSPAPPGEDPRPAVTDDRPFLYDSPKRRGELWRLAGGLLFAALLLGAAGPLARARPRLAALSAGSMLVQLAVMERLAFFGSRPLAFAAVCAGALLAGAAAVRARAPRVPAWAAGAACLLLILAPRLLVLSLPLGLAAVAAAAAVSAAACLGARDEDGALASPWRWSSAGVLAGYALALSLPRLLGFSSAMIAGGALVLLGAHKMRGPRV